MHHNNTPHPDLLVHQAAEITTHWLRHEVRQQAKSPSPAMDDLAFVLHSLLHEPLRAGRLRLHRDHKLQHPSYSGSWYEVDLWIHDCETHANGAIDVDAFSTHDRNNAEFLNSRRRWREIRRAGVSLEVIAAEEVRENVWAVGLEIVDLLGHVWRDLRPVEFPADLRQHAEMLARQAAERVCSAALHTIAPTSLPSLAEIRSKLLALPVSYDPDFSAIRKRFPRCGAPYSSLELQYLRGLNAASLPARALEEALLRPISALQRQLRKMS